MSVNDVVDGMRLDMGQYEEPIRPLNDKEQELWSAAVLQAVMFTPPLRDMISLLRPYYNAFAATASTSEDYRVSLSPWFFSLPARERASVVLHEVLHMVNNHFPRAKAIVGDISGFTENILIATDMEINCSIRDLPQAMLPEDVIYPNNDPWFFTKYLTFEIYHELLKDQNKKSKSEASNSNGPGKSETHCDAPNSKWEKLADDAGISRAPSSEQVIARRNTEVRVREYIAEKKHLGIGNNSAEQFYERVLQALKPPKVDWRNVLRNVISSNLTSIVRGRTDYSFQRPNRRRQGEFIFPGPVKYNPKVMFAIDTSGSMSTGDYEAAMAEVEGILKTSARCKGSFTVFCVDMEVKAQKLVSSVKDIDFLGGGGTDMGVAYKYVAELPKKDRPDIFVLATDAGTPWAGVLKNILPSVRNIILVTSNNFGEVPKAVKNAATVINIF